MKDAFVKADRTIVDLQCRSMRDNLVFTGISEPEPEYDEMSGDPEPENVNFENIFER